MKQYLAYLAEYISFKSISTDSAFNKQLVQTANWLDKLFIIHGFSSQIFSNYGNPIVLASYHVDSSFPTCLIYGHYDVQPADITDGWTSDPFTLRSDGKKLYGRGVVDNKGQILIHMVAIFDLIKRKELGMNIIFIIEGDEESGGADFERFFADYPQYRTADFSIISDGTMKGNKPTLEAGLRGGFNATLTITTDSTDVHSGVYGGAHPNATHILSRLISSIHGDKNTISIPQFYADVDPIPEIPLDQTITHHHKHFQSEHNFHTQTGLMPAIETTGILGGYTQDGYRNSIPGKAIAKLNFRLVRSQEPRSIAQLFETYIKKHVPAYASYTLTIDHIHNPVKINTDYEYVKKACRHLKSVYKQDPIFSYSGGAIPIVCTLQDTFKIPTILINLGNEDSGMHEVGENFDIDLIKKGLEFSRQFFS